jgi:hypothetical protein
MKLRYFLLSILAGAALAAGCAHEQDISSLAEFKPETSCVGLPYEGGMSSAAFTATASWSVEESSVPDWLTVSPTSGGAGSDHLVFASEANPKTSARTVDILVNVGGRQQRFTVTQAGAGPVEAPISTIAEVAAGSDGQIFRIRATVVGFNGSTPKYGNLDLTDGTGSIHVYRLENAMGQIPGDVEGGFDTFGIEIGDIVTVQGPRLLYGGTKLELEKATLIEVEKAQILMDETAFKVGREAGSLDIYATVKANGILVNPVDPWIKVKDIEAGDRGDVVYKVEYEANETSKARTGIIEFKAPGYVMTVSITQEGLPPTGQNVTDILALDDNTLVETLPSVVMAKTTAGFVISVGSSAIYVYDKEKTFVGNVAVGDNVKVFGTKSSYNGVPQIGTLTGVETDGTASVSYPAPKDVTAEALTYKASGAEFIQLTGTLKVSNTYYNIEIDGVDSAVKQGSMTYPADELNAASFNQKAITVTGYFNGLSGGGKYLNIIVVKIEEAGAKGSLSNPYTPAEATEAAKVLTWASNNDYQTTGDVYMKGKITRIAVDKNGKSQEFSTAYGNASFYISEDGTETGEFYVFRTLYMGNRKWEQGDTQVKVGDEVVIYGPLMNYQNDTPETVANKTYLYSLNGKTE